MHILLEEGSEIKFNDGDLLQEVFAFNTTEANLATIQTLDGYTVKEIRVYDNGKDLSDRFYASELLTQLTDTVAGLHEYSGISYDPMLDGMGRPLNKESVLKILAGASDAMRVYTLVLERI